MSMGSAYSIPIKYTILENVTLKGEIFQVSSVYKILIKVKEEMGQVVSSKGKMSKLHPDNLPSHPMFPY